MASTDHRSAAEIEREIEEERSALTRTLDEIQDRLSFEALSHDMMGSLREHGGDIGRSISQSVKQNPVPLALTAIGLVWLVASSRSSDRSSTRYSETDYDYAARPPGPATPYSGTYDPLERDPLERRYAPTGTPRPVYDASGRPVSTEAYGTDEHAGESRWDRAKHAMSNASHAARDRLRSGRDTASRSLHNAGDRASEAAEHGRHSAASRADAGRHAAEEGAYRTKSRFYGARDSARGRAQGAYASAAELRERITHGTQELSEQARSRVLAARTRAYEAQLRAEHYAARGRDKVVDLYEDQPLIGGAVALALGAVIGSLLPSTRREDEAFGDYRDELFEEAERIYREERSKLQDVARTTADEARRTARGTAEDIRSDAEHTASDAGEKAKEAVRHVADTAREEAEKKDLGQRG